MANCIKRMVEDVLVDSKGPRRSRKETSRRNTKFQATIRFRERESYRCHPRCRGDFMKIKKWWRGKQKKVFQEDECKTYNESYSKLGTNEVEKNIYKHTKSRKMKTRCYDLRKAPATFALTPQEDYLSYNQAPHNHL